jgi:hypothetical protein
LGIGAATSPALKTRDALVRRQASMFTAVVFDSLLKGLIAVSSQVLAVWKMQQGFVSNHRIASGFHLGKIPNLEHPEGSYKTAGRLRARFLGSKERGRSMIIVCVKETPKSCIIFADLMPGTAALTSRFWGTKKETWVLGIIE